jgi:uncharacterized membrane protein
MTAPAQGLPQSPAAVVILRADYPALSQSASDTSRHGQNWYRRFVLANLILLVAGAAFSGIIGLFSDRFAVPFAVLIILTLLCAMAANFVNWRREDDDDWFLGRAVAESVKTATWRYMMRTEPFAGEATCDQEFAQRLRAILSERKELRQALSAVSTEPHQITARMREVRRLGVRKRYDIYVRERLDKQIAWYGDKAWLNGKLAERWFWASFGAEFVGLLIALSSLVVLNDDRFGHNSGIELINLVGVAAALAVAFTAWTQLGRHNELNKSYGLAWQELLAIKDVANSAISEEALQNLVRAGEDAISREHTMWVAKHG